MPEQESTPQASPAEEAAAATKPGAISRRTLFVAAGSAAVVGGAVVAGGTSWLDRSQAATPPAATIAEPVFAYTEVGNGLPLPATIPADASAEFRVVAEALLEALKKVPLPGAALGVFDNGREEYAYYGIESMNTHVTVGPDTLFQLGSLTKTYTATTIWRLIDEGKLGLNVPVRDYLPQLRLADEDTAARLTIANLLDHTAGFYGSDGGYSGEDDQAIARYVDETLPTLPQIAPLGTMPSYNNDGFALLGRLVEVASGTTYRKAIDDLLSGPLQLPNTVLDRGRALSRPHVDGHYQGPINGNGIRLAVQTPLFIPRSIEPAGGLWATARDVLAYGRFHLTLGRGGPGDGIVSGESLQQMQSPVKTWPGLELQIGRNWFVQERDGVRAISHNGDTAGCHAVFAAFPERKLAVTLLLNVGGGVAAERAVLNAVTSSYPGLAAFTDNLGLTQAFIALNKLPVTLSPGALSDYTGTYADPGQTVTLTKGGPSGAPVGVTSVPKTRPDAFAAAIPEPPAAASPLTFAAKDSGLINGIERVGFVRNSSQDVGWLARGLRLTPRTASG